MLRISAIRRSKQIKKVAAQVHSSIWPTGPSSGREEEARLYAHTDEPLGLSLSLFEGRFTETTAGLKRMSKAKALTPQN